MDTTEAKAVLAEVPETEQAYRFRAALGAMIAEVERLTAPLDADEGPELVAWNKESAKWHRTLLQDETAKKHAESASLIERQAARIAALTAIPADVEGLCEGLNRLDAVLKDRVFNGIPRVLTTSDIWYIEKAAAALRQYAAREAIRDRVDAEVRAQIEALDTYTATDEDFNGYSQAIGEVLAILDTAKPAPDSLAKLRREVEELPHVDSAYVMAVSQDSVLALIRRARERQQ